MRFYNTLGRNMQDFQPIEEKVAKMYTCGPTVYNYAHIGNFRAYLFEDLLRRSLEYHGYKVTQVMNLTDVDDKTIRDSRAAGLKLQDFTRKYKDAFFEDLKTLRIEPAEHYPEATTHIPEMIEMIRILFEKGFAYKSEDGSVYFSIAKFKDYGKLAKIDMEQQRSGVRIKNDEYAKDSVADFALWKAWDENDGDVAWDSPWGKGRPGWHIECSAMAMDLLGETIDIHGGGPDLVFPHHENEIAQSEAATGHQFARTWMHSGPLRVRSADGKEEKMSKSLGNFFTVRDVAEKYGYEPIRFLMISSHYRSPINYSTDIIEQCKASLVRLYNCRDGLDFALEKAEDGAVSDELLAMFDKRRQQFIDAMSDDLNTADAIAALFELVRDINSNVIAANANKGSVEEAIKVFDELAGVLGLVYDRKKDSLDDEIEALIEQRTQARKDRNWAEADRIRDELKAKGIVLEDTAQGVKWHRE